MKCLYCKGEIEKGKTTYSVNRKGYHLLIEDIPAFVCRQCGKPYFQETELDTIQHLIQDIDEKTMNIQAMKLTT